MNANAPKTLLAKPPRDWQHPAARETLVGHLNDTFSVGQSVMDTIGTHVIASFGLDASYADQVRQTISISSYLHDLGKANSQFHRALLPGSQLPQALRHEWISVWLPLRFPDLDRWLFDVSSAEVRAAVLFSVLGHHLKLERRSGELLTPNSGSGEASVTVFCDHPDFRSCLQSLATHAGFPSTPPVIPQVQIDMLDRPLAELRGWLPEANQWFGNTNHNTRCFIAACKALLIAADVAGSAVPKAGIDVREWTQSVLERVCSADDLSKIADASLGDHPKRQFQTEAAKSTSQVTFIKAGCGSGKTTAAYLWASAKAAGRKLFFCYPTTGTATEGFRDYVIPAEMSADAMLLHSRSKCDLEYLLPEKDNVFDIAAQIESLSAWDIPLIVCTVDQVLGLIQNFRRPLFHFRPLPTERSYLTKSINTTTAFSVLCYHSWTFSRVPLFYL